MRSGGTAGSQVAFPDGRRSATSEWSANVSSTKCKMMINASRPAPGRVEDNLDVLDGEDRLGRSANFVSGQRCAVSPTANYRHRSPGALFPFHDDRGALLRPVRVFSKGALRPMAVVCRRAQGATLTGCKPAERGKRSPPAVPLICAEDQVAARDIVYAPHPAPGTSPRAMDTSFRGRERGLT